jgi:hypothetical protein
MSSDQNRPITVAARAVAALVTARTVMRTALGRERPGPEPGPPEPDPAQRTVPADRRAETLVAVALLAAAVCGFGFVVIYIVASTTT